VVRKTRTRKLSVEDRLLIVTLVKEQGLTQKRCAEMFSVSQARVSQIITNYYGEFADVIQ